MKTRRRKKIDAGKRRAEEQFTMVQIDEFETVCQVCEAEFLDEEDLKLHIAQVHLNESNGKTICKLCCGVLPGPDEFVSHYIIKHLENSLFCYYCYRVFSDPLGLDRHELKHCAVANDTSVTCSQCSAILIDRQELQKHEFHEHGKSEDGFMLNGFFSLLSSALNVNIKKFIDCLCNNQQLVCHKCKYPSSCVTDYIEHLKTSQCKCFACDTCFNVYKKKSSIIHHMVKKPHCQNFVIEEDIKKACTKCNKYFSSKDIGSHRASCNVVKCPTCNELFDSVFDLTEHRVQEHRLKISLQTCKFCRKQFVGTLSLKKHMHRSHKNRNLYKYNCVHCGSLFTHPSKLFAHFFTRHKDMEPYTCKICNKCFRLRKNFTIHIKLQHKSIGFVEFDKNLHVTFSDQKSENPIAPRGNVNMDSTTDASDSDSTEVTRKKRCGSTDKLCKNDDSAKVLNDNLNTPQSTKCDKTDSDNKKIVKADDIRSGDTIQVVIERLRSSSKLKRKRNVRIPAIDKKTVVSPEELSDSSEQEPLSVVRQSLLMQKTQNLSNSKRKTVNRDKKAKLTCNICKKYCYTVQNYHHHLTLHEKTKMKRCIKCNEYFKSRTELKDHIESSHSSSKLIDTLRSVLEKRKKVQPAKPGETFKSVLEKRKKRLLKTQNTVVNKFRQTIRKVNVVDDCTATITPISDHGLSVKNFIENFKPEADTISISNSVTMRTVTSADKEPVIKMHSFNPAPDETFTKLRFPVKFRDTSGGPADTKISVKLVQQLITKPSLVNMSYNERIPTVQDKGEPDEYCNMFADETDYTQYKNDVIPEVAHEVMLEDLEDIPRTRRLAQEIIIPRIPDEYGGVRIGHLLPQAPYYKIVKVKKLLSAANEKEPDPDPIPEEDVTLPDGTRLISVKNPYSHLIPNEHLEKILKANRTKYYTPKTKNIEKAIAKALKQTKPPRGSRGRARTRKKP